VGWILTDGHCSAPLAVDTSSRGMGIAAALLMQAEQDPSAGALTCCASDTIRRTRPAVVFPKVGYVFAG